MRPAAGVCWAWGWRLLLGRRYHARTRGKRTHFGLTWEKCPLIPSPPQRRLMAMHTAFDLGSRPDSQADFRQLRHQTKNALARIVAQVSSALSTNDSARRVAAD